MNELFREPYVYALATLTAIAVYIDISRQDSLLNQAMLGTQEVLLQVGEKGLFTSVRQALNCDSDTARLIMSFLILVLLGLACRRHWISRARRNSIDPDCPSPEETKRFTQRLTPKEYEF